MSLRLMMLLVNDPPNSNRWRHLYMSTVPGEQWRGQLNPTSGQFDNLTSGDCPNPTVLAAVDRRVAEAHDPTGGEQMPDGVELLSVNDSVEPTVFQPDGVFEIQLTRVIRGRSSTLQ